MSYVLFADDQPRSVCFAAKHIEGLGIPTVVVTDGEAALRLMLEDAPYVLVTDTMMPRMDGFELLRRWQEASPNSRTGVVLLTPLASDGRPPDYDGLDCSYLIKPYNPWQLVVEVTRHLSSQGNRPPISERTSGDAQVGRTSRPKPDDSFREGASVGLWGMFVLTTLVLPWLTSLAWGQKVGLALPAAVVGRRLMAEVIRSSREPWRR